MTGGAVIHADVLVVGAGSAGCVVAAHLARDPTRTVVLLERGPLAAPGPEFTRLTGLPIAPGGPRVTRYPEARGRDVVRGTGIGGSAAVNGGYFLRGHRDDYRAWPWPVTEIADEFARVERTMRATPFADAELGPVAAAFDRYWRGRGTAFPDPVGWPRVGLNRVRSNRIGGRRRTTADAFLLRSATGARLMRGTALQMITESGRVTGVLTDRGRIAAGEVVLAAGTVGSAALLAPLLGPLPVHEHPEQLVRFVPRIPIPLAPLLQVVLHTASGVELRCYSNDFAAYIPGVAPGGVCLGIADMARPTSGTVRPGAGALRLDLGAPDAESRARMASSADEVVAMLGSAEFAHLVTPGTVTLDERIGMSSHAWGTVPLGRGTAPDGTVDGTVGLRVVDASVLPGPLHSGPHATVIATAALIARRIDA